MVSSLRFRVIYVLQNRPIQARFHYGFPSQRVNQAAHKYSLAHSSIGTRSLLTELSLVVSKWFQVLFHGAFRPSFHLSLMVLVHYRSCLIFSLGVWSPQIQKRVCRLSIYSGTSYASRHFCLHGYHVLWPPIPRCSANIENAILESYNPG